MIRPLRAIVSGQTLLVPVEMTAYANKRGGTHSMDEWNRAVRRWHREGGK